MSIKKSTKWIVFVAAAILTITCFALGLVTATGVFAAEQTPADKTFTSKYFSDTTSSSDFDVTFEDGSMKLPLASAQTVQYKRTLNDFSIILEIPTDAKSVTLGFSRSALISGAKAITDTLVATPNDTSVEFKLNDGTAVTVAKSNTYQIAIDDKNAVSVNTTAVGTLNKYGVEDLTLSVSLTTDSPKATLSINSLCDVGFATDTDGNFADNDAAYKANEEFLKFNKEFSSTVDESGKITKKRGYTGYTLSASYTGVFYNANMETLTIKESENGDYSLSGTNKIAFNKLGNIEIEIVDKNSKRVTSLSVESIEKDEKLPYYVEKADAADLYEAYAAELKKCIYKDYDEKTPIQINDSITLPSLRGMVKDNVYDYDALSCTVYYMGNAADVSSNSITTVGNGIKFTLKEAGNYSFYIVFTDPDNKTVEEDAVTEIEDNFTFKLDPIIFDKAPTVEASSSKVIVGFIGTSYTANSFTVSGADETKYKLYYSATKDANADAWKEIPRESLDTEDEYDENYDGSLTFIPQQKGFYKIVCTAYYSYTASSDEVIISIIGAPKAVKPATTLTTNNILSIVFLCIGGAALIGLLCVIFIKPKNKDENTTNF